METSAPISRLVTNASLHFLGVQRSDKSQLLLAAPSNVQWLHWAAGFLGLISARGMIAGAVLLVSSLVTLRSGVGQCLRLPCDAVPFNAAVGDEEAAGGCWHPELAISACLAAALRCSPVQPRGRASSLCNGACY